MSVRFYLVGLGLSGLVCAIALVLTIVNTNPAQGQTALASFYISGFFATLSLLTLVGYLVRRYLTGNELRYANLQVSFRQAFLVGALLVGTLFLQALRLVSWWDLLLLAIIAGLSELYLRSNAKPRDFR